MSPKKRQMRRDVLSVVMPEALSHTIIGKTPMIHTASNMPLRLIGEPPYTNVLPEFGVISR